MTIRFSIVLAILTLLLAGTWMTLRSSNRSLRAELIHNQSVFNTWTPPVAEVATIPLPPIKEDVADEQDDPVEPNEAEAPAVVLDDMDEPIVIAPTVAALGKELGALFRKSIEFDSTRDEEDEMEVFGTALFAELMEKLPGLNGSLKYHKEALKTPGGQSEALASALSEAASLDSSQSEEVYHIVFEEKARCYAEGLIRSVGEELKPAKELEPARKDFDRAAAERIVAAIPADKRDFAEEFLERWKISLGVGEGIAEMISFE